MSIQKKSPKLDSSDLDDLIDEAEDRLTELRSDLDSLRSLRNAVISGFAVAAALCSVNALLAGFTAVSADARSAPKNVMSTQWVQEEMSSVFFLSFATAAFAVVVGAIVTYIVTRCMASKREAIKREAATRRELASQRRSCVPTQGEAGRSDEN